MYIFDNNNVITYAAQRSTIQFQLLSEHSYIFIFFEKKIFYENYHFDIIILNE